MEGWKKQFRQTSRKYCISPTKVVKSNKFEILFVLLDIVVSLDIWEIEIMGEMQQLPWVSSYWFPPSDKGCLCVYIYNSDGEESDTRICRLAPANLLLCHTKLLLKIKAQSSLALSPWTQGVGIYIKSLPRSCSFLAARPHPQPRRKCSGGQKEWCAASDKGEHKETHLDK